MSSSKTTGVCHLCGLKKKLTFEHVPPKQAFNKSKILKYQDLLDDKRGTWQQRGAGAYTLCSECNSLTGTWYAPSYIEFTSSILRVIDGKKYSELNEIQIESEIFPLRLLKQILTMFFSLNGEGFQKNNLELKEFVLHKESQKMPLDLKVLICLFSNKIPYSTGVMGSIDINNSDSSIYSCFSFFPLTIILGFDSVLNWMTGAANITEFFKFGYDTKKAISLKLISIDL